MPCLSSPAIISPCPQHTNSMYRSRTKFNACLLEMWFSTNAQLEYDQAMFLEIESWTYVPEKEAAWLVMSSRGLNEYSRSIKRSTLGQSESHRGSSKG